MWSTGDPDSSCKDVRCFFFFNGKRLISFCSVSMASKKHCPSRYINFLYISCKSPLRHNWSKIKIFIENDSNSMLHFILILQILHICVMWKHPQIGTRFCGCPCELRHSIPWSFSCSFHSGVCAQVCLSVSVWRAAYILSEHAQVPAFSVCWGKNWWLLSIKHEAPCLGMGTWGGRDLWW